jgi:hypothetical protein
LQEILQRFPDNPEHCGIIVDNQDAFRLGSSHLGGLRENTSRFKL